MTDEKILKQIRAILAKAEDGSGCTEDEAASALQFARRMMIRHQVDESELAENKERTPHEIAADAEYDDVRCFVSGTQVSLWETRLGLAVAALVGTVGMFRDRDKKPKRTHTGTLEFGPDGQPILAGSLVFYGPEADARDAAELQREWTLTIASLARLLYGGAFRGDGRSYAEGFAAGLLAEVERIDERERQLPQTQALTVVTARELMAAKREHADDWLKNERGVNLRKSSRRGNSNDPEAYGQGKKAGREANFSRERTKRLQ